MTFAVTNRHGVILRQVRQPVNESLVGGAFSGKVISLQSSGHYMYRTVVTICTAQWSLYVPHSGHYMYCPVVTICIAHGHNMYRPVVTICIPHGHYMYRTVVTICTAQWSLYVLQSGHYMYRTVVTICAAQWSLYVPHSGHYMYHQFNIQQLYILPTHCIMCFVWISEQTAIISLYNIN